MPRLTHGLIALLAASSTLAQRLADGQYKISYSPAPCGIETKHYLDLPGPIDEALFNPIPESDAQVWTVSTSATDSTWRRIESVVYPDVTLGYPTARDGIRVRGDNGTYGDSDLFTIRSASKQGYYYVYPYTVNGRDFVLNGNTRTDPELRNAYFRGNITNDPFPLPMLPLEFIPVTTSPTVGSDTQINA